MSPNASNKNSLDFLSDHYFNTKSPVAFTSQLASYRETKNVILSLLFVKLKLGYNPKTPSPFINQFIIIFRETVIVTGIDDQWQADLVNISSLVRFNKGYKVLLHCIAVFSTKKQVGRDSCQRFSVNLVSQSIPGKATDRQRN